MKITPYYITNIVAALYSMKMNELMYSPTRSAAEARYVCIYLFISILNAKKQYTAFYFGIDHATVTHGMKIIADLKETDKVFVERLDTIMGALTSKTLI
ncbi:MAG: hypothetical protein ACOYO1_18285 [Bacteroidales bacterium]